MLRALTGGMLSLDRPLFVAAVAGDGYAVLQGNAKTEDSSASSHTINLPAGIQAGDLLFVYVRTGGTNINMSVPGDWTTHGGGDTDASGTSRLLCKVADGSEGASFTIDLYASGTGNPANRTLAAIALRFSGHDGYHSTPSTNTGSTGDPPNVAVTDGTQKHHYLAWVCNRTTRAITAAPSGFDGLIVAYTTTVGSTSTLEATVAVAFLKAEDADYDPGAFTGTWSASHAATSAVSPA